MKPVTFDLSRYPIPLKLFIDGEWTDSVGLEKQTMASAVNDAVITTDFQWANAHDIDIAVESAERGLQLWQAMSNVEFTHGPWLLDLADELECKRERRDALIRYGALIREHAEEIFWLEAVLVGKERGFSTFETTNGAEEFNLYGNLIDTFHGQVVASEDNSIEYILHQPYGVCAAICPFNGPIVCYCMKVAPALAAGNSIVVKASETNPFSTLFVASLAVKAGIPPGVVNCVTGGAEAGAALAAHMKIRKISFTGSLAVARHVQVAAAKSNLKSVTLELGGKSPIIVFPDANLESASKFCASFLTLNGQGCMLGTRVYLHESIMEEVLARLRGIVKLYEADLGSDPLEKTTWSSPLFHRRQKETVMSFIEHGKREATLFLGGESFGTRGCYVQPTIFTNPCPDAKVLKEEIFGPVLVVVSFKTDDEVLRLANDTEYGLGAYLWTNDMGRCLRFGRKLEAGTVSVNGNHWNPRTPFGGWKQSGQGVENGIAGLQDWTQNKSVRFQAS